jgi:PadR family transcriptional regulator PadR
MRRAIHNAVCIDLLCDTHYYDAMGYDDTLSGARQELRRGTLVPACLLLLRRPGYGYALLEELGQLGFEVDAGTLYPLLRRLEGQGMLLSQWNTEESRPRKFYRTSPDGERLAAELLEDWTRIDASIRLLGKGEPR